MLCSIACSRWLWLFLAVGQLRAAPYGWLGWWCDVLQCIAHCMFLCMGMLLNACTHAPALQLSALNQITDNRLGCNCLRRGCCYRVRGPSQLVFCRSPLNPVQDHRSFPKGGSTDQLIHAGIKGFLYLCYFCIWGKGVLNGSRDGARSEITDYRVACSLGE